MRRRGSTAPSITSENVGERLSALCPNGIDVFFDNVGGKVLNGVLARIDLKARIGVSGAIALYNDAVPPPGPANGANLIVRTDARTGFIVLDYASRFAEAREDVAIGLENAPRSLMRLFTGENFGKQLLKIADPRLP